jgi:hypothetical protein
MDLVQFSSMYTSCTGVRNHGGRRLGNTDSRIADAGPSLIQGLRVSYISICTAYHQSPKNLNSKIVIHNTGSTFHVNTTPPPETPLLAGVFPTVPFPPEIVQSTSPHTYPPGQHPPPTSSGQTIQPPAHPLPVPAPDVVVAMGTTIVTPFEFTTVLDGMAGQEVGLQSRPVRQQPPWYTALQA